MQLFTHFCWQVESSSGILLVYMQLKSEFDFLIADVCFVFFFQIYVYTVQCTVVADPSVWFENCLITSTETAILTLTFFCFNYYFLLCKGAFKTQTVVVINVFQFVRQNNKHNMYLCYYIII